MGAKAAKAVFLKAYPAGMPAEGDFTEKEIDVPAPGAGEMLCRTVWMSVDPYMRGRMRPDVKSYIPPFSLDRPLEGGAVSEVVESNIEVRVELSSEPLRVKVDRNQILQVFLNLVVNARDAMPHGGVLKIETGACSGQAVITVSDTGHGMDEATRLRIFEPFFTTKAENRGTGLGLATVFGIVNQSGGSITVTSSVTEGTTFEVRLPLTGAALKIEEAHTPRPARQSSGVILVAEDNDQLRELLEKVLTRAGFKVLSAANPVAAIKLAQGCRDDIDVLLTDIMMPEMNGMELASELRLDRPDLQVIYMSGYTGEMVARAAKLEKGVNFLPKPVKPDRLLEVIQNRLGLKVG